MSVLVPFPPLRRETLRAIVVVGDDGETAVALRDALPRQMAVVLDARPDEAAAAIGVCRPCPCAIVWSAAGEVPAALDVHSPTVILVAAACAAPVGTELFTGFSGLLARLREMLAAEVGGMRLAPGVGVAMPGGSVSRSPWLQALVSTHPAGVPAQPAQVRAARRSLLRAGAGWTVARGAGGTMALVHEEAAA